MHQANGKQDLGGLGCLDEANGSGELAPVSKELAPVNSISSSHKHADVEEVSVRAIQILVGRLN